MPSSLLVLRIQGKRGVDYAELREGKSMHPGRSVFTQRTKHQWNSVSVFRYYGIIYGPGFGQTRTL